MKNIRLTITVCALAAAFGAGILTGQGSKTPSSIIHVSTIQWKADSTQQQRTAALEGVKKMAAAMPGIKNVWIKATKVQPGEHTAAFVIEFADRAAADAYVNHPAHKEWEKIYIPVREESFNSQITN